MATVLASKWDPHKETIRRLYMDDKISLDDLVRVMNEKYHFTASKRVFERQLKQWAFHKNKRSAHMKFLKIRLEHRHKDKKDSDILVDGVLVPKLEIERKVKQCHVTMLERYQLERCPTPEGVIIRTPTSEEITILTPTSHNYMQCVKSRDLPWIYFLGKLPSIKNLTMWIDMPPQTFSAILPALCPRRSPTTQVEMEQGIRHLSAILPVRRDQDVYALLYQVVGSNYASATIRVLELALYVISNRLCRGRDQNFFLRQSKIEAQETLICHELLRWFQMGDNYLILGKILSYNLPTIEAFAERIFDAALEVQDCQMAKILLSSGMNPDIMLWDGGAPLQLATQQRNLTLIHLLLDFKAKVDIQRAGHGRYYLTPIAIAASNGALEIVQLLFLNGASVDRRSSASSPLQMAALGGHLEIVQFLLNVGANINSSSSEEYRDYNIESKITEGSPLECAIRSEVAGLVELLLDCGADVDYRPRDTANTPLQSAAMMDDDRTLQELIRSGADINAPAPVVPGGRTALKWAVRNGNDQLCQILIQGGAGPDSLVDAVKSKNYAIIELLLEHGADINDQWTLPSTALETAVELSDTEMVMFLLSKKADSTLGKPLAIAVAKRNHELVSILLASSIGAEAIYKGLCKAVVTQQYGFVELLLREGRDHDSEFEHSELWTPHSLAAPLVVAVEVGNFQITEILLLAGADCNAFQSFGDVCNEEIFVYNEQFIQTLTLNSFQAAAELGNMELVSRLLDAGAELNCPPAPDYGRTALQAAVESQNVELIQFLIKEGADLNCPAATTGGFTALQAAIRESCDDELVKMLLAAGANANDCPSIKGHTSLQLAALNGRNDIISLLLAHGADVNAPASHFSSTALEAAIVGEHAQSVHLLIESGADVNTAGLGTDVPWAGSHHGPSAIELAAGGGFLHIADLLLAAGADVNTHLCLRGDIQSALVSAAYAGRIDMLKLLLNAGADIASEFGRSQLKEAMKWATRNGHDAAAKFLKYHQLC